MTFVLKSIVINRDIQNEREMGKEKREVLRGMCKMNCLTLDRIHLSSASSNLTIVNIQAKMSQGIIKPISWMCMSLTFEQFKTFIENNTVGKSITLTFTQLKNFIDL